MDPSDVYRPDIPTFADKDVNQFRDFTVKENDPITQRIFQTYIQMHTNQTVDFVKGIAIRIFYACNFLIRYLVLFLLRLYSVEMFSLGA